MNESVKLTIRLTPDDMALLTAHTRKAHLSQSAYLRALIRGYVPKAYPPEMFFDLLRCLERMSAGATDPDTYRELLAALLTLQEAVTAPERIED